MGRSEQGPAYWYGNSDAGLIIRTLRPEIGRQPVATSSPSGCSGGFIPLHLCSVAGLAVLMYALWPRQNWLGQLLAYAFVPAAFMAVVFPSTTMYPWLNFYCIHTFVFHGLILAFFAWLFMSGEVVPDYRGLWLGFLFMVLFGIPIYFLDSAFQVNYMYLGNCTDVSILAKLWDRIVPHYGRPGFAVALGVIMLIDLHVFYAIYRLLRMKRRFRRTT